MTCHKVDVVAEHGTRGLEVVTEQQAADVMQIHQQLVEALHLVAGFRKPQGALGHGRTVSLPHGPDL